MAIGGALRGALALGNPRRFVTFADRNLKRFCLGLLLPGLLLNVTVSNQGWMLGPFLISQVLIFWPLLGAASVIVLLSFPRSLTALLVIGAVVAGRAAGLNSSQGPGLWLYFIPLSGLFVICGSIAAVERCDHVRTQMNIYFLLTVPFMVAQLIGVGDWTLALNTETTAVSLSMIDEARTVQPTLFVPASEESFYAIGQARPAGFMHANNMLSLAIVFAMALHFSRLRSKRVTWTDALYCGAMVVAMAKIVIVIFAVMIAWLAFTGTSELRRRVRGIVVLTGALYGIYWLLFPGVFDAGLNQYKILYSVGIRLSDILFALGPEQFLSQWLAPSFELFPTFVYGDPGDMGELSGYATAIVVLPLLALPLFITTVGVVVGRTRLKRASLDLWRLSTLSLAAAILFPAAMTIWRSPLFWFMVGFGVFPALAILFPRFYNLMEGRHVAPSGALGDVR